MIIRKPTLQDLDGIRSVLTQWTEHLEVEKYIERIQNEINGYTQFGMHFWVADTDDIIAGVGGLSDILPSIRNFSTTDNPGEIKILYLDDAFRGKGFGKLFISHLENEARIIEYTELLIRSAKRYEDTAYLFYEKMGYKKVGVTDNEMTIFLKKL